MTLGEFFERLSDSPYLVLFYFMFIPFAALLGWIMGKGEGHLSPWNYFYSAIVFLICIPGIFAITLNIYLFLFERMSIMDANVYTQILPIMSMIITLWVVKRNVNFDQIPGFDKISALLSLIFAILVIMWILEKTHIFAITFIPFQYVLILFVVLFVVLRIGSKKLLK